ncbi:hypothetical protein O181_046567 [Austropuccinia psidii MF-1]|uniref:Uncharacterized protein n=1 Tax=Austropuccinia psidii MF-1 TaxID=1389203 RepID=A0A9Q3DW46_9BASI|nr:hypothetical protein [Austropuccinia psidii MF-1]
MHLFSPAIQWHTNQMVISAFYSGHPEDSSRLKDQFQSQIPMISSSNHWLFSFTVFLQGSTGNILSRDIQEAVPKPVFKCQCSITPTWKPHSFQYSLDSSRPVFQSYIMVKSFNPVHFPIWKGIHSIRQSIQTSCQPEAVKLSNFHIYQPPLTLGGSSPVN